MPAVACLGVGYQRVPFLRLETKPLPGGTRKKAHHEVLVAPRSVELDWCQIAKRSGRDYTQGDSGLERVAPPERTPYGEQTDYLRSRG